MQQLAYLVNPLQGTASDMTFSTGNTLPLLARPFGMHHWTLQTAPPPWLFHPEHRQLWGIRLTHQPSPWMGDYGSLLVQPFNSSAAEKIECQASAYQRDACLPGYLRVRLLRYGIALEMTPTRRGAVFAFTSERNEPMKVRFSFEKGHTVHFTTGNKHLYGASENHTGGVPSGFALSFYGEFSETPESFTRLPDGGYWTFSETVRRVELRLAASFINPSSARRSLESELLGRSLEYLHKNAMEEWNGLLGRLPADSGDDRQNRTYYSCLYRCLLFPRSLEEIGENGNTVHYSPYDGLIHDGPLCTDNGFWDTYRTVYPLLAFAYPDYLKTIMEGWLNACHEAGWAPKWASPGLKDCMIGTHFNAVVAEAVARGITDWDVEGAFAYLWKDATTPSESGCYGRQGLEDFVRLGYLPVDKHPYSVSATLDYAYDDFCVAQVARFLGRHREAEQLLPRAQYYRNLFDPSVGFMRERLADGNWKIPFSEFRWGGGYVEGGPWQHTFNVPHDPAGLASLFGGEKALCRKLDTMLATPPIFDTGSYPYEIHEMTEMALAGFGQYAQSNQPVHAYLFLYALAGEPEKTSHWVRRVASELYSPERFPGDEDNGEMAAWYVWATLGLYPHCPGKNGYVRFAPLIAQVDPILASVGVWRGSEDN